MAEVKHHTTTQTKASFVKLWRAAVPCPVDMQLSNSASFHTFSEYNGFSFCDWKEAANSG